MATADDPEPSLQGLRRRAEALLERATPRDDATEPLMHELQVHQIELQMQNEELRRAQAELEQSRDRYLELYDSAPIGYLGLDRKGTIEQANRAAVGLLGADHARLIGRPLASRLSERDADILHRHLGEVFAQGTKQSCEVHLEAPAGEAKRPRVVRIDSIAFPDPLGADPRCRSVLVDLSELRRAEEDLQGSEAQFREIAEHLQHALLIIDRDARRITYANPAFESIFEVPVADLYHDGPWPGSICAEDQSRVEQAFLRYYEGAPFDETYQVYRPGGEHRRVRARVFPIEDDGSLRRDVGLIEDVTDEYARAEELRQVHKMEAVGALASGVAHDFNNVLQAILGCINVARREGVEPARAREFLDRAARTARRGGDLASQLTAFTRKQEAVLRPVELDGEIVGTASLLERLVTERITVRVDVAAPGAAIIADPVQIEQILMNLAANARDAMPNGGVLSISTSTMTRRTPQGAEPGLDERFVRLVVEDTGTGMDMKTRTRIFEPFYTTKEPGKGTGLGLSTVFAVVEQLGGHIEVDSAPGEGTRFTLSFPYGGHLSRARESSGHHELARFRGTVLLVEDDPVVRMTVRFHLQELGLEVLEAGEVDEALRLCAAHRGAVDLLVTDVILPQMRGPELARMLRDRYPRLQVLLMSASPDLVVGMGFDVERTPVLRKPFGLELLARALETVLGDSDGASAQRAPEPAESAAPEQAEAQAEPSRPRPQPGTGVVLLVEDQAASLAALRELLSDQGYRVLAAGKPSDALALAAPPDQTIDLLLTDLQLPEVSGLELARRLREGRPDLRIIFMSGQLDPPPGEEPFVHKPIDFDSLLEVIERTLAS